MDWAALVVFVILFAFVTILGFMAARWQKGDLEVLHEWALAGRRFGTLITWFVLGGDTYTAYTFVALPALVYGIGAPAFFALSYSAITFPLLFIIGPRFWAIAHNRHYITFGDFVRDRYDSRALELAIAWTGIAATMLYIALNLVGLQVVIKALGFATTGWSADIPVVIAFAILAAYTYRGGMRAPALVAIVKDVLIYVTVITAVAVIPAKLGGFEHVFAAAQTALANAPKAASTVLAPAQYPTFVTLAIGSALALVMYPHVITATVCASAPAVIRRNSALLPVYTVLLGLLALFGYMAHAAGIHPATPNDTVPDLLRAFFPSWFFGVCLAAIGIGALVPAAIMSIAAANLYSRNIHRVPPGVAPTGREETAIAKTASLVVKTGALLAVLFLPAQFSIYYQLFAGALILQTFPAIVFGLYTRWFHRTALFIGWAVSIALSIWMIVANNFASTFPLKVGGTTVVGYVALWAFALNLIVSIVLTAVFDAMRMARGTDRTAPADYEEPETAAAAA
jgi:solute:Na+ symporter, SSS family